MIHHLRALMARLRGLFGDRRVNQELDDEIEMHMRLLAERYVRQGMSEAEAAWAARRQFGNVTLLKEVNRGMRGLRLVDTLFQDLWYGVRMLRRNAGFTCVAVLTLALGIGANTAIFSVVNAVLLRSLPYRDPDRLVVVSGTAGGYFLDWRDQAKSFEKIAAYTPATADLKGSGELERLDAGAVSANLFATLGVAPALGRAFTSEEDTYGGPPVVILSDTLWRRRFGGDPQVIGRVLTVGDQSRTIVGIMPPGFRFPGKSDLWMPLAFNITKELAGEEGTVLSVIARLKPGVTPEAASTETYVIIKRKSQASPGGEPGMPFRVTRLDESLVGNVRLALLILFGAVAFVLLIACANVANLFLARSAARQKEMAIRAAVGAGRLRLVRQLLTESLLLSLVGGTAGLLAAKWGVELLVAMSPAGIERIEESSVDGRVLGFTCLVVVLVGLLSGIIPALQASKVNVNETLKSQSATGNARSGHGGWLRALPALMIAELALALVLLVGAGLMIKSFLRLLAVPKGFNPDSVLTLELTPSFTKPGSPQCVAYFQEARARVQALPGIQSASLTSFLPFTIPSFDMQRSRLIEGRPGLGRGNDQPIQLNHISPDYFQTMGIEIRSGRPFGAQDGKGASRVAIINETLARLFLPNENPIGQRLLIGTPRPTIVGVVGDTHHLGLDQEVRPEVYLPYVQHSDLDMYLTLAARVASNQNNPASLANLAAAIRNQVQAVEPNEPVNQVVTMDERLSNSIAGRRYVMLLLSIFAAVAFVIATVGIYGVISYAVNQRTHEIGVRMALGARSSDVLRMVIWWGMSLTLIGVALGLAAALGLTRVLKNQLFNTTLLFNVSATDPATLALITLLLVGIALIASYIPARRATKVDPLQALHHE